MAIRVKIIDLSPFLENNGLVYPTYPRTVILPWTTHKNQGYESNVLFLPEHSTSHVDSPAHMLSDGKTIDELPLDKFVGVAAVLDFRDKAAKTSISEEDLKGAAKRIKLDLNEEHVVLLCTGWDKYLGKTGYFSDHPGLSEDGAMYIANKRVKAVGIDTPSIDNPELTTFPAHRKLFSKEIIIYEGLINLQEMMNKKCEFMAFPIKIRKGTGSPIRAVAIVK